MRQSVRRLEHEALQLAQMPYFIGGPGRTRTCNQTVMSGEDATNAAKNQRIWYLAAVTCSRLIHAMLCASSAPKIGLNEMTEKLRVDAMMARFKADALEKKYRSGIVDEPKQSYVYFVSAKATNHPIKIGLTTDTSGRFQTLKNAMPYELEILGYLPIEDRSAERDLHKKFSHIRLRGEWFERTDDLMAFIATLPIIAPVKNTPPEIDLDEMYRETAQLLRDGAFRRQA